MLWYILLWMHVCFCCVCFSFSVLRQEIGWEERLRNYLFCVGWGVTKSLMCQCVYIFFLPGSLSFLCSLTRCLAPAKLQPNGAVHISLLLLLLRDDLIYCAVHSVAGQSNTSTFWAATNAGLVYVYQLTVPAADKREEDIVQCILGLCFLSSLSTFLRLLPLF